MSEEREKTVFGEVSRIMAYLSNESSESKNIRARFRHAVSVQPSEDPMLWGWLLSQMDDEMQGKDGNISCEEYAIYITLSMFAIGPRNDGKHTIAEATANAEIKRQKLVAVETATGMEDLQASLRGLIKLLDSKGYGFSYGQLAEDLFWWQKNKTKVARKWEREYARKEKE